MTTQQILATRLSELESLRQIELCHQPDPPVVAAEAGRPRNAVEARLCAVWSRVLGVAEVGPFSNFFDLGGYSLNVVKLFAELHREFGTSLPFTVLFEAPTVEQLAVAIELERSRTFDCVVPVQPKGSEPPLFLIHSYLIYDALGRALGNSQPLYGMLEPPMEHRKPPYALEDLARLYADGIQRIQPRGPYAIAGWCAAGIVALEVARQLESRGEQIRLLGLIDAWCPVQPVACSQSGKPALAKLRQGEPRSPRFWKAKLTGKMEGAKRRLWRALASFWLNRKQPLPKLLWNPSELTFESIRRFQPKPVDCPIVVFRAEAKDFNPYDDAWCGWRPWTHSEVILTPVPGNHLSMFHEPQLHVTAARIQEHLSVAVPCSR